MADLGLAVGTLTEAVEVAATFVPREDLAPARDLVDAIRRRRQEGEPMDTAIVEAGAERFRPIIMTTTTTVLALLPMALGLGAGDELRRPLALTVIGGLSVATVLTLIVIPCLYRSMSPDASKTEPVAADLRAAPQGEG